MKRILYVFMCFMLVLSACNKEESGADSQLEPDKKAPISLYGVKSLEKDMEITILGVAQKNKLWFPNTTIKVKLFDGTTVEQVQMTKACAADWEKYAGINFEFVTSGKADVRITFDSDVRYITWSLTGTDSKFERDQTRPTASFADWDIKSEATRKGDLLRIFGQILGLELEHRNTDFSPNWRSEAKAESYWADIEDIDWDEMKEYVFDPLDAVAVLETPQYDPLSIMVWPFPSSVLKNTTTLTGNNALSAKDIEFINTLYPKQNDAAIVTIKTAKQSVNILGKVVSQITVDWGDGTQQIFDPANTFARVYTYTSATEHTIKIYGGTDAIVDLYCRSNGITYLDISKNEKLESVNCGLNQFSTLDISKNKKLRNLNCDGLSLSSLDVSQHILLENLNCTSNQLADIDVSNLSKLKYFDCRNNRLTSINISSNALLETFHCETNQIEGKLA